MKPRHDSILRNDTLLRRVWEQLGRPSGCRVTGGYVRDRLLGRSTNDLDLTIDGDATSAARPAKRLAKALGVRAHLLGAAPHRIWRIETASLKIELWPLGELTHEEDIQRRDFSCNALSWRLPNGPLVDLVGGLDDLGNGHLRAIARANLESDPVRLIRGPRFLAQLTNFELDEESRTWIRELAPSLATAPRERVGQELTTLLRGPAASRALAECLNLGLFVPAAPTSCRPDEKWLQMNINAADSLSTHTTAGRAPTGGTLRNTVAIAQLAFLFRAWGLPADRELAPYAWPKTVREKALSAARLLDDALSTVEAPSADRRELAWRAGAGFPTLIALASALEPDQPGWRRWWRQWQRNHLALENPQPLLDGTEVSEISDIEPGPELGRIVNELLRAQIRDEVRSRRGAIEWLLQRASPRHDPSRNPSE